MTIFGRCNPKLGSKTYGFCPTKGYGLWVIADLGGNTHPPTWWTQKDMGFQGLWVIKHMGNESFNCIYLLTGQQRCGNVQ